MVTIETETYTEDDLMRLSVDDKRYELVNGELMEMSPNGIIHVWVTGTIYRKLFEYVMEHKLGYVFNDNLIYVLHTDPTTKKRTARVPDTSFLRRDRLDKDVDLSRPFFGAPNLAIEVMSPNDSASELLARIRDYFTYGTEQVWVFYPDQKEVHQHINGQAVVITYVGQDQIDTSAFFPELTLITEALFDVPNLDE